MEVLQKMKERFWLKPVAFLLGVLAWFYVNIISTTPITREYKVKISYLNKDDSKNYKVIPESPEVKVRVKGPRGVFIQTKVEDNTFASVDLINCHGGKLTLPVNVIFPTTSNLQLVSKEPAQLVINAIKMTTKKVKVKINKKGNVPEGYLINEPSVFPTELTVTAPAEIIDTISECRVDLYLDDIKRSISEYRQAQIVYDTGSIESDPKSKFITIDGNNVKLDLAVREGYPEKQVTVRPSLINKPPEGRKLDSCIVTPEKITISGSAKLLDNLEELVLEQVDLAQVSKTTTLPLNVVCPKGIKLVGISNVSLSIKYTDVVVSKTFSNLPIEFTHNEDQIIETDVSTYSLELEGLIDDLNATKASELNNIIYLKGFASGSHFVTIEPPYGLSERIKIKSIKPASFPVIIRLMEKVEEEKSETTEETMNDSPDSDSSSSNSDDEASKNQIFTATDSINLNAVPSPTSSESVNIEQSEPEVPLTVNQNASSTEAVTNSD